MKRGLLYLVCLGILLSASGCSVKKISTEKRKDLSFRVLDEEEIPKELKIKITEKASEPFKMTYSDAGELYIAQGYGERENDGYHVEVMECYETENAIYIHTDLIGPAKDEKIVQTPQNPHVVVRLDAVDKDVVFE